MICLLSAFSRVLILFSVIPLKENPFRVACCLWNLL